MAKQKKDVIIHQKLCKVCNSDFRGLIENLHIQKMNPRKIMEYLNSLSDPEEQNKLKKEELSESTIRRHLDRHFDIASGAQIKIAETKNKVQQSRDAYKQGVKMMVDSVSTISYMIDLALINIEDLDNMPDGRQRHQLTINYMSQIKSLVESFAKLTGELKQEGTIDVNFFNNQITEFANIVLSTIRELDRQMNLNNQLEYSFAKEFKKQWDNYQLVQQKMINGELPLDYGAKDRNVNSFNDGV